MKDFAISTLLARGMALLASLVRAVVRPSLMLIVACCWLASTTVAFGDDKLRIELETEIARLGDNYRALGERLDIEMWLLERSERAIELLLRFSKREAEDLAEVRDFYDTAVAQAERCKEFVKLVGPVTRVNGETVYTDIIEIPASLAQSAWEFLAPNERANCLDWLYSDKANLSNIDYNLNRYESKLGYWKSSLIEQREKLKSVKVAAKQTRLARREIRAQLKELEDRLAKLPPCVEPEVEPESTASGPAVGPSSEEEQSNELDSGNPTIPELNLDDLESDDDSAAQDFTPPDPDDVLEAEDSTGEVPAGPHGAEDILDALKDEKGPTSDPAEQVIDVDDGKGMTGLTLPDPAQTTPIAAPKTPDLDIDEITMFPPDVLDAEGDTGTSFVDVPDMLPDPDDILDADEGNLGANSSDQGPIPPISTDNNDPDVPVNQGTQVPSAMPVDPANMAVLIPDPMIYVTGRRDQSNHCDYDPVLACRKLGGERAQICEVAVAEWVASCRALGAITDTRSPAHCVAECNVYADQALLDDQLRPLISSLIEKPDASKDDAAQLEAQLMAISDEIAALNKQLDAAVLHIYQHETTGEITQHDGPYFEPSPPLEYTGSIRKTPTAEQRAKLLDLELLAEEYTERLRDASNGDPLYSQWQNFARGFWFGIDGDTSQMSKFTCTAAQAETARAACIDKCNTANGSGEVCDPFVSAIGMLNQPFSRIYLYPPGNALRAPVN